MKITNELKPSPFSQDIMSLILKEDFSVKEENMKRIFFTLATEEVTDELIDRIAGDVPMGFGKFKNGPIFEI